MKHEFLSSPVLYERGISDVDNGKWARKFIQCRWCGQQRKVWRYLNPDKIEDRCTYGRFRRVISILRG